MTNNEFKPTGPAWTRADGICDHPHSAWFSKGDSIVVMAEGFNAPLKMSTTDAISSYKIVLKKKIEGKYPLYLVE